MSVTSGYDNLETVREGVPAPWARTRLQVKIDRREYRAFMLEEGLGDETSSEDATPLSSMNSDDFRKEKELVRPPGPWSYEPEDCSCNFDSPGPRSATRSPSLDPRVPLWPAGAQVFGPPGPRVLAPGFRRVFGPPGPTCLAPSFRRVFGPPGPRARPGIPGNGSAPVEANSKANLCAAGLGASV